MLRRACALSTARLVRTAWWTTLTTTWSWRRRTCDSKVWILRGMEGEWRGEREGRETEAEIETMDFFGRHLQGVPISEGYLFIMKNLLLLHYISGFRPKSTAISMPSSEPEELQDLCNLLSLFFVLFVTTYCLFSNPAWWKLGRTSAGHTVVTQNNR